MGFINQFITRGVPPCMYEYFTGIGSTYFSNKANCAISVKWDHHLWDNNKYIIPSGNLTYCSPGNGPCVDDLPYYIYGNVPWRTVKYRKTCKILKAYHSVTFTPKSSCTRSWPWGDRTTGFGKAYSPGQLLQCPSYIRLPMLYHVFK